MPTLTSSYKIISTISTSYGEIRTYGKYTGQSMEDNCTYYRLKQTYYLRQYINTSSATGTLDGSVKKYGYTHFLQRQSVEKVSLTSERSAFCFIQAFISLGEAHLCCGSQSALLRVH